MVKVCEEKGASVEENGSKPPQMLLPSKLLRFATSYVLSLRIELRFRV